MTTTYPVPQERRAPDEDLVRIGAAISGSGTLLQLAQLLHFVRGRGYQLVPYHATDIELTSGSEVFRYRVEPSGVALQRVWAVALRSTGGTVNISAGAGAARAKNPPTGYYSSEQRMYLYLEDLAAKSSAEQEITFTVQHVSGTRTYVDAIGCWELPRAALASGSPDYGFDQRSLEPGRPIYESTTESINALATSLAATLPRRHLVQQWFSTVRVTSGTPVDIFVLNPPAIPTKRDRADTTRTCKCKVYARVDDVGTKGTVTVYSDDAGDSQSFTQLDGSVSTSFAWIGPVSLSLSCEDLSDPAGLPSGGWESLGCTLQRDTGSGNVEIRGISLLESAS